MKIKVTILLMREEILSLVEDRTGDAVFPMQAFPRLARLLAPNAHVRLPVGSAGAAQYDP